MNFGHVADGDFLEEVVGTDSSLSERRAETQLERRILH
jgi:hypothetical protein